MREGFTHPGFVRLFGDKGRAAAAQYPSIATFSDGPIARKGGKNSLHRAV